MRALLILAAVLLPSAARAQQPDHPLEIQPQAPTPESTLSVKVQVVAINAVARNQDKELIHSLDKSDFTLRVDGKPTDIRYFSRDSDLPLTIGLVIDTSGSQREFFDEEARASTVFLTEMITQPTDRAFVARFDSQVLLLQPLTSRLPLLRNALRLLDYKRDDPGAHSHGGTLLFDAIGQVAHTVLTAEPGRRAVVILTDGDDNGSYASLSDAIRLAQLADVAVYSVLYTNEMIGSTRYPAPTTGRPSGIDVMQQISRATGGREFIVGTGTPITRIYAQIAEDLRSQYRLGFTPLPAKPGKPHTIDLRATDKRLTIQSRTGYFTPE